MPLHHKWQGDPRRSELKWNAFFIFRHRRQAVERDSLLDKTFKHQWSSCHIDEWIFSRRSHLEQGESEKTALYLETAISLDDQTRVLLSGLLCVRTKSPKILLLLNTTARVLAKTKHFDHMTPILASPHWLPLHVRSDFKGYVLVTYKMGSPLIPIWPDWTLYPPSSIRLT